MKTVASMGMFGFIKDIDSMMIKLFEYFVISDRSQSVLYYDNISSLPFLIREAGPDLDKLKNDVFITLNKLYTKYWTDVNIEVDIDKGVTDDGKNIYYITVAIQVMDENGSHVLNKTIQSIDNNINGLNNILDFIYRSET